MLNVLAITAICLVPPVNGRVVADYSPAGQYAGHWGVDHAAEYGQRVYAPVTGVVTFAGSVAGMRTVTIQPLPGFKVSVSYLSEVSVEAGVFVKRGTSIGKSGLEDGIASVHLSTRINGEYADPAARMGCGGGDISRALRLVEPPAPYPRRRANRNPRRNLRPDSHRTPSRR